MARDRGSRPKGGKGKLPSPQPQPIEAEGYAVGYPKFCLRFLQPSYDVHNLPAEKRADFALTLQQKSSLTWQQLHQAGRHAQGYEHVPRSKFYGPIPKVFDDIDRFMVFRYSGMLPMAGVRSGDVFHVIWIEAAFNELYDHGG